MGNNKQKKVITIFLIVMASFFLTGCKQALDSKEAGILFVNRLIYDDKDKRFEKNFVEGVGLDSEIEELRSTLIKGLVTSFNEFGGVISLKQTEDFLVMWMDKMEKDTYFEAIGSKSNKKAKTETVTFRVGGLDFQKVYKDTMDELVKKMLEDPGLVQNNVKLGDLTVQLLSEAMEKAEVIDQPVEVTLTLKKVKKQWKLVEKLSEEEGSNLLLTFMAGVNNLDTYSAEISAAVTASLDEALNTFYGSEKEKEKEKTEVTKESEEKLTPAEKKNEAKKTEAKKADKERTTETIETIETYDEGSSSSN